MPYVEYSVLKRRHQLSLPSFDMDAWGDAHLVQFNELMVELTKLGSGRAPRPVTASHIQRWSAVTSLTYVIVGTADEETGRRLVSTATLNVIDAPINFAGQVNAVVIHPDYQGKGLARPLMAQVHLLASELGLESLELTSSPTREAANALYRKLGYLERDTNCYKLRL